MRSRREAAYEIVEWLWLILLGFGTGVYGVLVGAGGGFILGPILLIFFGMDKENVAGTTLALVAVNSISGSIPYLRMGLIDKRSGLLFVIAAIPGTIYGVFALSAINAGAFRILFGGLLLALAAFLMVRPQVTRRIYQDTKASTIGLVQTRRINASNGQSYEYRVNEGWMTLFNLPLGFISSFFGVGGGFLRTPILVYGFNFPVQVAVATSIFTLAFITTIGAVTHALMGHVDWFPTFVWAGIGLVAGGQVGARLAGKLKGVWILRLLMVIVLVLGIRLVIEGIQG
ncbi:MAG: sulfite exporter TauE/SafE family protein [Chloroflexi bacterium]|nr:sulfite exporter TauE/SafE family protein [Chloroflexota bacterium]